MQERLRRTVTWALAIMLVASIAGVAYIAANPPRTTEPYTEFYILGADGNASGYPSNLTVGETGEFVVGITNHERSRMNYTIIVVTDNRTVEERTVDVSVGENWEGRFEYTPQSEGQKRVRLLLYQGSEANQSTEPYRWLRLPVNVSN